MKVYDAVLVLASPDGQPRHFQIELLDFYLDGNLVMEASFRQSDEDELEEFENHFGFTENVIDPRHAN